MLPRERDGTGKCGSDAPTRLAALYLTNEDLNFIRDGIPSVVANLQPMTANSNNIPIRQNPRLRVAGTADRGQMEPRPRQSRPDLLAPYSGDGNYHLSCDTQL
jgi:hypothetical protein